MKKKNNLRLRNVYLGFGFGLAAAALLFCLTSILQVGMKSTVIIIILAVVALLFGYIVGKEVKVLGNYSKAWDDGYREGRIDAAIRLNEKPRHPNCRASVQPVEKEEPPEQ